MCCNWHVRPHKLADREGVAALARPRRRHCNKPRPSAVECRLPSSHSLAPERRLSPSPSFLSVSFVPKKALFSLGNKDAEQQRADSGDRRERAIGRARERESNIERNAISRSGGPPPSSPIRQYTVLSGADASMRNSTRNSLEGDFCKAIAFSIPVTSRWEGA